MLLSTLLPADPNEDRNIILEIRAGAGGDEAGLFASELLRRVKRYVVAAERLDDFKAATGFDGNVVDEVNSAMLIGLKADHPWIKDRVVEIYPAPFVTMDTGTGLVHIAPGGAM